MKVCFETFGCRLNKAESLQMEADYLSKGWTLAKRHADADLFVVRGCSVTARAQADCERLISHLRRRYPAVPIRICGCLASRSSDARPSASGRPASGPAPVPMRTARAYLKVQDGCAGTCTFCIVPTFRGPSRAVDFTEVLDRARRFADVGYHEIVLTGCNLTLYASQGKRLPDLVASLAEAVGPEVRLRLGSVEPGPTARRTAEAMAAHTNVCRFLHLPVQSGANTILKAMGRPYDVSDVTETVALATRLLPGLGLGCDLMTGFPGEGDLEFVATQRLLQNLPFTSAHVFPYSERSRTPAAEFRNVIPKPIRSKRAHALADIAHAARLKFAKSFVGKAVAVVIEDEENGTGWTEERLRCTVLGKCRRKSLVRALVTEAKGDALSGRLL